MPFYCFECGECKQHFKVLQQSRGEKAPSCPDCGSQHVRRLLPHIGVVYKGSGYYSTDHRVKKAS